MSRIMNTLARSLSAIALLVFLISIIGCTTNAKISFDKIESKPDQPISAVILMTEIEGVTLPTGDEVKFNERRGRYNRKAGWIRGETQVGDSVEIRLSDIDQVLIRKAGIEGPQTIRVKARSLKSSRRWRQWSVLRGRSVIRGNVVKFDHEGARYDAERQLIVGRTNKGGFVEIDIDDVLLVQERKFSVSKTVGLVGLVGATTAAMVLIPVLIELNNWSWSKK